MKSPKNSKLNFGLRISGGVAAFGDKGTFGITAYAASPTVSRQNPTSTSSGHLRSGLKMCGTDKVMTTDDIVRSMFAFTSAIELS